MNIEAMISHNVCNGKEVEVSLALLERSMHNQAIKHWIDSTAKKLGCTATIHWKSDVVTFYQRGKS